MDKDCQTMTCDTEIHSSKRFVMKLRCSVCAKFKASIATRWNFRISGADSIRNSNVSDHAWCDQHVHAMNLLKREQARAIVRAKYYIVVAKLHLSCQMS